MTSRGKLIEYLDVLHGGLKGVGEERRCGRETAENTVGPVPRAVHAPMDPRAVWRAVLGRVSRAGTLWGGVKL